MSRPELTVGLPFIANIDEMKFDYVPYDQVMSDKDCRLIRIIQQRMPIHRTGFTGRGAS